MFIISNCSPTPVLGVAPPTREESYTRDTEDIYIFLTLFEIYANQRSCLSRRDIYENRYFLKNVRFWCVNVNTWTILGSDSLATTGGGATNLQYVWRELLLVRWGHFIIMEKTRRKIFKKIGGNIEGIFMSKCNSVRNNRIVFWIFYRINRVSIF